VRVYNGSIMRGGLAGPQREPVVSPQTISASHCS
jgi:hypothetical protein